MGDTSAQLLISLRLILDDLPACLMTRVAMVEQHYCNCILGSMVHYYLLNHSIYIWHEYFRAIKRINAWIRLQALVGLNGLNWFRELSDGVHLKDGDLLHYCHTVQCIINAVYRL